VHDYWLIGLLKSEHCLTAENCLNFLEDCLPELLEDVLVEVRQSMRFQHNGASAHFARCVRQFSNQQF
jgi:hypothetical protein